MKIFKDEAYDVYFQTKLDIYLPEVEFNNIIIYFHGGGLEVGDKYCTQFFDFAKIFTEKKYGFVSVNYRMYTNNARFPDFLNDASKAISYIYEKYKNKNIYVAGQSAGAWITLMLCLNKKYLNQQGIDPLKIQGWIIDSAQTTSHFNVLKYEKGLDSKLQRIDEFAPLYFIDENTRFSKMLVLYYEDDMPCRVQQNQLFVASILNFNAKANIESIMLPKTHCYGSTFKEEDGQYRFIKEVLLWLEK